MIPRQYPRILDTCMLPKIAISPDLQPQLFDIELESSPQEAWARLTSLLQRLYTKSSAPLSLKHVLLEVLESLVIFEASPLLNQYLNLFGLRS